MSDEFAARIPKHSIVSLHGQCPQAHCLGGAGVITAIVATVSKGIHY
jgi:hypothetical protein